LDWRRPWHRVVETRATTTTPLAAAVREVLRPEATSPLVGLPLVGLPLVGLPLVGLPLVGLPLVATRVTGVVPVVLPRPEEVRAAGPTLAVRPVAAPRLAAPRLAAPRPAAPRLAAPRPVGSLALAAPKAPVEREQVAKAVGPERAESARRWPAPGGSGWQEQAARGERLAPPVPDVR